MTQTHKYLMPEYYPDFLCKCGACRSCCCNHFKITLSVDEYYALLGLECSPALKRRLDCAFCLEDEPCHEKYASINHNFLGLCPLQNEDGYCGLQREKGEKVLTSVCRYYPRSQRITPDIGECACSCGCEGVIETLMQLHHPMRFLQQTLSFDLPEEDFHPVQHPGYHDLRKMFLALLQNRKHRLSLRMIALLRMVFEAEKRCAREDDFPPWISSQPVPDWNEPMSDSGLSFSLMQTVLSHISRDSRIMNEYGTRALSNLGENDGFSERYEECFNKFSENYSDWEIWFEQILVNHVFYSAFPFVREGVSLKRAGIALYAAYLLMKALAAGCLSDNTDGAAFADCMAAAYCQIENSNFYQRASALILQETKEIPDYMERLIAL